VSTRPARPFFAVLLASALVQPAFTSAFARGNAGGLSFEVSASAGLFDTPRDGRLFVVIARSDTPEPRFTIGSTGLDAPVVIGKDVSKFVSGAKGRLDDASALFPIAHLADLPPGDYFVQALFDDNNDVRSLNAPGNCYSKPRKLSIDPSGGEVIALALTERVPPEQLPPESEFVKYVKIQSKLLTAFHKRPMYLRAGVILPRGFGDDAARRYPLDVNIGGYGDPYSTIGNLMAEGSAFRGMWLSDSAPRMILVELDGDGPFGDSYQVNSANNGPYGDAVTGELIPAIEKKFRGAGKPESRFLTGGSTGGWVSLALQVFYPDSFNGTWSGFPDPVDFRAYQLVDIYRDTNAYINRSGFERPAARARNGDILWTMRHEVGMENVMGAGNSYTRSGGQWGAWNAAFGPKSSLGGPAPLWDPHTGRIDTDVATQWKKYDLRLVLQEHWQTLGPKLKNKLHIWVGEADDFFLNNAVHLLDEFLSKAEPAYGGWIRYGPGQGHGWSPLSHYQIMMEMTSRAPQEGKRP
jgi:S-formylglutathione hydrolase FrmB